MVKKIKGNWNKLQENLVRIKILFQPIKIIAASLFIIFNSIFYTFLFLVKNKKKTRNLLQFLYSVTGRRGLFDYVRGQTENRKIGNGRFLLYTPKGIAESMKKRYFFLSFLLSLIPALFSTSSSSFCLSNIAANLLPVN